MDNTLQEEIEKSYLTLDRLSKELDEKFEENYKKLMKDLSK